MQQTRAKRKVRRTQLLEDSLIVGLDIGKNRHALWMIDLSMQSSAQRRGVRGTSRNRPLRSTENS